MNSRNHAQPTVAHPFRPKTSREIFLFFASNLRLHFPSPASILYRREMGALFIPSPGGKKLPSSRPEIWGTSRPSLVFLVFPGFSGFV
jgi:hypothetical protein